MQIPESVREAAQEAGWDAGHSIVPEVGYPYGDIPSEVIKHIVNAVIRTIEDHPDMILTFPKPGEPPLVIKHNIFTKKETDD